MNKITVAVIFGGQSTEHEVSRTSACTIISHLNPDKYYVIPVGITKKGEWLIYNGPVENIKTGEWERYGTRAILSPDASQKCLLKIVGGKVKEIPIDVVFPILHGMWGEDGTIQGLLEMAQIPYVGCGVLSSSVCMDKVFTKLVAKDMKVKQAKYLWFSRDELGKRKGILTKVEKKIGYPCFIKPANSGSSVGIRKAENKEELEEALTYAARFDRKVIVEEMMKGREVECAVLGNEKPMVSCVGEVLAAEEFYTYDAKYNNPQSQTVIPAQLPDGVEEKIKKVALKMYQATECSGLARIDFFVREETNEVVFNEINTMPGFTPISMYPELWENAGKAKQELMDDFISLALTKESRILEMEDNK